MEAELETTGRKQVDIHYVNAGIPSIVEVTTGAYYLEHGDFSLEEVLQDQEILYQSFQTNNRSDTAKAPASSGTSSEHDQSGDEIRIVEKEGESSQVNDVEQELASDEALARYLQDLENSSGETTETAITPSPSSTVNRELNSTDTTAVVTSQDNVNPDNMTYEELQSLAEEVGTESRGLSEELISYLSSSKYKTGRSSRKDKHEECVICCMEYKNKDNLITLPCQHHYHKHCITRWLKLNKACPICNVEVFGP